MSNSKKDHIELFFDYNIDIKTKTLYLGSIGEDEEEGSPDGSGIDYKLAEYTFKGLHILDDISPDKPITVVINNSGGDTYHAMSIYDKIRSCESKVITKVVGVAMSGASIILQAGDERIMTTHSVFMMHYGSCGTSGVPQDVYNWTDEYKRVDKVMEDLYFVRMNEKKKTNRKKVKDMLKSDTILTAEECLELGFIDKIE